MVMAHKVLIPVVLLFAVVVGTFILLPALLWPNRVMIRNASGQQLENVRLVLSDLNGNTILTRDVAHLGPDSSIVCRHDYNDFGAELRFVLANGEYRFDKPLIDLWRGEGYVFEIQPDGSVEAGNNYPRTK